MPKLYQQRVLPYSAKAIFDLVIDIESYPQFLPWCSSAKITKKIADNKLQAQLGIEFKGISEHYLSDVSFGRIDDFDESNAKEKNGENSRACLQNNCLALREASLVEVYKATISKEYGNISSKFCEESRSKKSQSEANRAFPNFSLKTGSNINEVYLVEAIAVRGPFKSLINRWKISAIDHATCQVDFALDFEFNSALLGKLIGGIFSIAAEKMMQAFENRAAQLAKNLSQN